MYNWLNISLVKLEINRRSNLPTVIKNNFNEWVVEVIFLFIHQFRNVLACENKMIFIYFFILKKYSLWLILIHNDSLLYTNTYTNIFSLW